MGGWFRGADYEGLGVTWLQRNDISFHLLSRSRNFTHTSSPTLTFVVIGLIYDRSGNTYGGPCKIHIYGKSPWLRSLGQAPIIYTSEVRIECTFPRRPQTRKWSFLGVNRGSYWAIAQCKYITLGNTLRHMDIRWRTSIRCGYGFSMGLPIVVELYTVLKIQP